MTAQITPQEIVAALPFPAIAVDLHGQVTHLNAAAENLIGKNSSQLTGKKTWALFHDRKQMTIIDEALAQGSPLTSKIGIQREGHTVDAEIKVQPVLDSQGETKAAIATLTVADAELTRLKSAINGTATPMMMVDREFKITFANPATMAMLKKNLDIFQKSFPGFDLTSLLGSSIDRFHKNPSHQRTLLSNPQNLPYRAEIQVGPLTFSLNVSAMIDNQGTYIGNTLEWHDITDKKAKDAAVRRLESAIEGSAVNFMMCDTQANITYCNPAVLNMLEKYKDDLKKIFPTFDPQKLIGVNVDIFHKKPEHQRRLFSDVRNLPMRSEIKVANLEFALNLSALYDDQGRWIGNAVEWHDQNARADYRREVDTLLEGMRNGNLSQRGRTASLDKVFGPMMENINIIIEAIVEPLAEVKEKLGRVATGDLTAYVTGEYRGDHQMLKNALNDSLDALNNILGQVAEAADQVANGARQVSDSSQALSQGATEQASSLEEITASMAEMSTQTKQNAGNATQANQLAGLARQGAERGNGLMQDMVKAMTVIDESSQNISKIIKAIDEIAFQTNLLALNAAVEAARAGVHGKGFAVVAEEVRNLAARSAKAAKETTEMIEGSIKKVNQGSEIARKTAEALVEIVAGVGKVTDLVGEIAAASNEQAQGISQVNQGLNQLDSVTQQNTSSAEESAAASEELSSQSAQLRELLSKFTLRVNAAHKGLPPGITPELFAALQAFMAQQGMPSGESPRAASPNQDWLPMGKPQTAPRATPKPAGSKLANSLDDREFGKY